MNSNYEGVIKWIYGKGYDSLSREESDGANAIAIVLSRINGVKVNLGDMERNIGVEKSKLSFAFNNLVESGFFLEKNLLKPDRRLFGKAFCDTAIKLNTNNPFEWSVSKSSLNAWCHVAAVGAGMISRNYF